MKRIAIIGGGISGLSAGYFLSRKNEVTLFEKEPRVGGHTHTVAVETSGGVVPVDTGFIVHNDHTYPNLIRLFQDLGVATAPSDMSFAVFRRDPEFEYASHGLDSFFAQRSNLFSPRHYLLLREIIRFNKEGPQLLADPKLESYQLGDWLRDRKFAPIFLERYLYPMVSAVWSMALDRIEQFPASTLMRFFANHGLFAIDGHFQWKVVRGGSNSYLAPLSAPFKDRIHNQAEISKVERDEACVRIHFHNRSALEFDEVVFACHGNQVLPLLAAPTERERDVMTNFTSSSNDTCLHTDENLLPRRKNARASWNYLLTDDPGKVSLTYYMNRLQSLRTEQEFCVTLNATSSIDPRKIIRRMTYHHPMYTREAVAAQGRWSEISGHNRTHFCGAYWFYGFHEDGLNSAMRVARSLGVEC